MPTLKKRGLFLELQWVEIFEVNTQTSGALDTW